MPPRENRERRHPRQGPHKNNRHMHKIKLIRGIVRGTVLAIVAIEKEIFFRTGAKMRTLRGYWAFRGREIQKQLDAQRAAA